jgi:hypothetical protein
VDAGGGSSEPFESPDVSAARERLREEIDRVREGVEEMLALQGDANVRAELERLRVESRRYAKRRVVKSQRRMERSIDRVEARVRDLEQRFFASQQERQHAEWRLHVQTEMRLDGILRELRDISELLRRAPLVSP